MKKIKATTLLLSLLMISSIFPFQDRALAQKEIKYSSINSDSKISRELTEAIQTDSDSSFPVVVLLNNEKESIIENYIEKSIGYTYNSLEEQYAKPSQELINLLADASNDSIDEYLNLLMKNHLQITEDARKKEKEKTDKYRATRRDIIKEITESKVNQFLEKYEISNKKVGLTSLYVPMIVCNLSVEEINNISHDKDVDSLLLYKPIKFNECTLNYGSTKSTMGINRINDILDLTGLDVNIGIYEPRTVNMSLLSDSGLSQSQVQIIGDYITGGYSETMTGSHATTCAGIAVGSAGIAPNASIYSASTQNDLPDVPWETYDNPHFPTLELLINNDVNLISISCGTPESQDCYNYISKYFDSLISNTKTTIVCSTGNNDTQYIGYPSSSYNCIAVNGFEDEYNGQNQNVLNAYSFLHGNGCFKPDVIAPSFGEGTSYATPYIAGMIALMYQYKPSLCASPETTKVILIGSCHKKCTKRLTTNDNNAVLTDLNESLGLSNRQGAGIPNLYTMISMVSQHTYGNGILNAANGYERVVHFVQPKYNSENINVSMAYLQTNVPSGTCPGVKDDIDLSISNNGYNYYSNISNSSTEIVYRNLGTFPDYTARIYKFSGNSEEICYAYAWSTNNDRFYNNINDEGIYYIKNYNSSLYLSNNNGLSQQLQFASNLNSMWVLDCVNNHTLKSSNLLSTGLGLGDLRQHRIYHYQANEI